MADNSSNTGNPPLIINIPAWTGQVGPEFGPIVTIKIIFDSGRPIDEAAGDRPDTAGPATKSVNDSADITTTGPVAELVAEPISEITTRTATRLVIDSVAESATEPINESDNVSSDSTTADAATEPAAETAANSVNDSTNVNLETAIFLVHQHRICNASPYLRQVFDSKPQGEILTFDDIEPLDFTYIVYWMYIGFIKQIGFVHPTLMQLGGVWDLAERMLMPRLQNHLIGDMVPVLIRDLINRHPDYEVEEQFGKFMLVVMGLEDKRHKLRELAVMVLANCVSESFRERMVMLLDEDTRRELPDDFQRWKWGEIEDMEEIYIRRLSVPVLDIVT